MKHQPILTAFCLGVFIGYLAAQHTTFGAPAVNSSETELSEDCIDQISIRQDCATHCGPIDVVDDLCASYPQLCVPCGIAEPCPEGDGGWLCCSESSGICALANGQCGAGHIFGYCSNYTKNPDGTVTCHDEP